MAAQLEQLGDDADSVDTATAFYRQAQSVLMPPGMVWRDREFYEGRKEAFERVQQKLYGLAGLGRSRRAAPAPVPEARNVDLPQAVEPTLDPPGTQSVWQFEPGLVVRIVQTFKD